MISNDWYTSFLCSVGIIDYDGLASSQKRKCLVILRTILVFSTIPCFVYHSLLTKAKPEAVKSQTSKNTRSFKQIKMNLNQTTKNGKASTWRLDWPRRMSVVKSWPEPGTSNFRHAGNTILIPTKPHAIIKHNISSGTVSAVTSATASFRFWSFGWDSFWFVWMIFICLGFDSFWLCFGQQKMVHKTWDDGKEQNCCQDYKTFPLLTTHTVTAYAKDGDYILGVVFHPKPSSVSDVAGIQSMHASLN